MDEQDDDGWSLSEAEDEGGNETTMGHRFDWGDSEHEGVEPDVLRFDVGPLSLAIYVPHVMEVEPPPNITDVPGLPAHVAGVAVRRRHVLSIVDLAVFLDVESAATAPTRLLVLESEGIAAGVLVSAVFGLEVWPDEDTGVDLEDIGDRIRPFVLAARWAPGGRVLLLDVPELLRAAAVR